MPLKIITLRVLPDEQVQLRLHMLQNSRVPQGCAFRPGRGVAGRGFSRIAKAHGQVGKKERVMEKRFLHAQPAAQAFSAGIAPHNARGVHLASRRLSGDDDFGGGMGIHNRPRRQGQNVFTQAAVFYIVQQRLHPMCRPPSTGMEAPVM